jgi:hypothetical protein
MRVGKIQSVQPTLLYPVLQATEGVVPPISRIVAPLAANVRGKKNLPNYFQKNTTPYGVVATYGGDMGPDGIMQSTAPYPPINPSSQSGRTNTNPQTTEVQFSKVPHDERSKEEMLSSYVNSGFDSAYKMGSTAYKMMAGLYEKSGLVLPNARVIIKA